MKSKEEILNSYYAQAADGTPEISAADLLKAMDEYAGQSFNAARELNNNVHAFDTYQHYQHALQPKPAQQDEVIRLMADSVVSQFLPTDPGIKTFSFNFKAQGINYTAHYSRTEHNYWEFISFE